MNLRSLRRLLLGGAFLAAGVLVFSWGVYTVWTIYGPAIRACQFSEAKFFANHAHGVDLQDLASVTLRARELLLRGEVAEDEEFLDGLRAQGLLGGVFVKPLTEVVRIEALVRGNGGRKALSLIEEDRFGEALHWGYQMAVEANMRDAVKVLEPARVAGALFLLYSRYTRSLRKEPQPLAEFALSIEAKVRRGERVDRADIEARLQRLPRRRKTSRGFASLLGYGVEGELAATGGRGSEVLRFVAKGDYAGAIRLGAEFARQAGMRPSVQYEFKRVLALLSSGSLDPKAY